MYLTAEQSQKMIVRNNQAYNRYFDAISRAYVLINEGRLGVCITVALTALLGRNRIRDFQPEHLSQELYRGFLYFLLLRRGIHLLAPQSLSDFYTEISNPHSRGALFMQPGHAFALVKLYDKHLLEREHQLSPEYKCIDTNSERGLFHHVDAHRLLELYEQAEALENKRIEYNPILIFREYLKRD